MATDKMTKEQAYATLGLPTDTPFDKVTERYHQLLKAVHPDVAGDALNDYVGRLNAAYHAIKTSDFAPDIRVVKNEHEGSVNQKARSYDEYPEDLYGRQNTYRTEHGYYYYSKSPDGQPFSYRKTYSYDGHAYGTPTPEDTRNQKKKNELLLSVKKTFFPLIYNFLTIVIRVAAILSMLCLALFILERLGFGRMSIEWIVRTVVLAVSTVVLVLLKYWIYRAAEADFTWNQEFRI